MDYKFENKDIGERFREMMKEESEIKTPKETKPYWAAAYACPEEFPYVKYERFLLIGFPQEGPEEGSVQLRGNCRLSDFDGAIAVLVKAAGKNYKETLDEIAKKIMEDLNN